MNEMELIIGLIFTGLLFIVGLLVYSLLGLRSAKKRIIELERRVIILGQALRKLRQQQPELEPQEKTAATSPSTPSAVPVTQQAVTATPQETTEYTTAEFAQAPEKSKESFAQGQAPRHELRPPSEAWQHVREFFTGGNLAVKTGVVVLFFGVSFLLKYAVEHQMLPVELRLSGAALGGIVLIATGWRLREKRRAYALIIQGGGVGILYLTTFAALRLYFLIPNSLAFFILVSIAVLSALLAILQDAPSMAVLGVSGGFLAPVLTSTGGGNYIFLFSYYAVLNASIMAIAWFRAWRLLNITGFAFTFIIGTAWGIQYYRTGYFPTTEPFLVLFFLMYVSVSVMFAIKRQFDIKAYLDGTLVFGTPIVAFGLQSMLVARYEYGMAISAFVLGAFYIALAWALFARSGEKVRLVVEAFLSFGVVFATLALPLAVDGRWTASAWALEGAAVLWAGVRQDRKLARVFGMLLQVGAGMEFASDSYYMGGALPVVNAHYLGCLLISAAGVFSSLTLYRHRERVARPEYYAAIPLLVWGILWWLSGGLRELDRHVLLVYRPSAVLVFMSASCLAAGMLGKRLSWPWLKYPALGILPVMGLMLIYFATVNPHPFAGAGYAAWTASFAACYVILYGQEQSGQRSLDLFHAAVVWIFCALTVWEIGWQITHWSKASSTWSLVSTGAVPALMGIALPAFNRRFDWPFGRNGFAYIVYGLGPVLAFAWIWSIYANMTSSGNPWPLTYMPLLNPLDIAVAIVMATIADWYMRASRLISGKGLDPRKKLFVVLYCATVFLWFNAVLVRTVHYWGGVSFSRDAMMASVLFHAALSIFWSVLALGTMLFATRRGIRPVWITGAALLGAVVLKLFLIDLSKTGTVARIVSFVVVGVLLLLVGYFSPVPPRVREEPGK